MINSKINIPSKSNGKRIIGILISCFLFSLLSAGICYAETSYSKSTLLTLDLKNKSVKEVLTEIEKNSEFVFFYHDEAVDVNRKVNIQVSDQTLDKVLDKLFQSTDNNYVISERQVFISRAEPEVNKKANIVVESQQQTRIITGKVFDNADEPLVGVTVLVSGTTNGAITDTNGQFTIHDIESGAILVVSYIGYVTQQIRVDNSNNYVVRLLEDLKIIDEVIVVGYGKQRKETLTGAIATIGSSELLTTKTDNVVSNLQGKLPGLLIRQEGGEPGNFDNNLLSIRGYGSPVIVIDGVVRTRSGLSDLAQLNSEDIDNISVLKDASAAIYGMNAANGVIIVTTKQGEASKARFSYSGRLSLQMATGYPDMVDAYTYRVMENEYQRNLGLPPLFDDETLHKYKYGLDGYLDWDFVDMFLYKVVPNQSHNISVRGGTDKVRYFTSLAYSEDNGLLKSDILWYKRYSFRNNLTADLTKNLSMNVMFSGRYDKRSRAGDDFTWIYKNIIVNDRGVGPVAIGSTDHYSVIGPENRNTAARIDPDVEGYRMNTNLNGSLSVDLTYTAPFLKGLSFNLLGSYDMNQGNASRLERQYQLYNYFTNVPVTNFGQSLYLNEINLYNKTYTKFQANYSFNSKGHSVALMGAVEASQERYDNLMGRRNYDDIVTHDVLNMASTSGQTNSGNREFRRYAAFLGRLNYDFHGKYLFEGMLRRDGSYRYAPSKRWVVFPSVSVGWRVSEESFFKNNISFINGLKFRASYGESGRDQGNPYEYVAAYTSSNQRGYLFEDGVLTAGMYPPGVVNDYLTWVTAKFFNVALDVDVFKNKLNATFEYFQRRNTGLLASRQSSVPNTFGASFPQENINSDMNSGIEVLLKYKDKIGKDFRYTIGANVTLARTKRLHVEGSPFTSQWNKWQSSNINRFTGRSMLYTFSGQIQSLQELETHVLLGGNRGNSVVLPGAWRLDDNNGDGRISGDDQLYVGWVYGNSGYVSGGGTRVNPPLQFGFNFDFKYKAFDLNLLFQGASLFALNNPFNDTWGYGRFPTLHSQFLDRWHTAIKSESVDENGISHIVYQDPKDPNSEWIPGKYPAGRPYNFPNTTDGNANKMSRPDATYLRLKNVELGYTAPKSLLKKVGVESVRFYLNGTNLLLFCKKELKIVDPEKTENAGGFDAGLSYPIMKGVNFGINLTF